MSHKAATKSHLSNRTIRSSNLNTSIGVSASALNGGINRAWLSICCSANDANATRDYEWHPVDSQSLYLTTIIIQFCVGIFFGSNHGWLQRQLLKLTVLLGLNKFSLSPTPKTLDHSRILRPTKPQQITLWSQDNVYHEILQPQSFCDLANEEPTSTHSGTLLLETYSLWLV